MIKRWCAKPPIILAHNWITTTQRYCKVSNLKVQRDYFKAMRNVLQRSAQPLSNQMFDPGGWFDINYCLTITKIKGRLITYNLLIIIEKSEFVTFYCYLFALCKAFEKLWYRTVNRCFNSPSDSVNSNIGKDNSLHIADSSTIEVLISYLIARVQV